MGTEGDEQARLTEWADRLEQARQLERWAAGHVDIGQAGRRWDDVATAGRETDRQDASEAEAGAGPAYGVGFPTADDVLDWWPKGDDTYRGEDGYRVVPPSWWAAHDVGRKVAGSWITAEQWRQAAGTPRQDEGTARRRFLAGFDGARDGLVRAWTWNRVPSDRVRPGEDGRRTADRDWAPFGEEVAWTQERDGHQTGPYWIDETHHWPGSPRITNLAGFGRWAARYRRFWETEQGIQPARESVPTPGPFGRVVDDQRRTAWAELDRLAREAESTVEYLVGVDAPRVLVALREALGWECIAAQARLKRWRQARVDARRARKG